MSPEIEVITAEVVKDAEVLTTALAAIDKPPLDAVMVLANGDTAPVKTTFPEIGGPPAVLIGADPTAPDHAARSHDKISPSKLNYLDPEVGGCPGFRQDAGTSAAAEDGTRLHEILDGVIKVGVRDHWFNGASRVAVNLPKLPSGSLTSLLHAERIRVGWDDLTDWALTYCAGEVDKFIVGLPPECIEPEIRVDVFDADGTTQIMYGHPDLCLIVKKGMAVVFDWKFGYNPVHHASVNRQGLAYAVGFLQRHPEINTVGVIFIQPKRGEITKGVFHRKDIHLHIKKIKSIRDRARATAARLDHPQSSPSLCIEELNPGDACEYCNRFGSCSAVARMLPIAVQKTGGLPELSVDLKIDAIQTPQQAALAMAWVQFLDKDALSKIKSQCMDIARLNGGRISFTAPDGTEFAYKIQRDQFDRVVGDATQVAETLSGYVATSQVLGAAKLSIGRLTDIVVPAIQARHEAETGEAMTKKAGEEQMCSLLESVSLLSRPDGFTESLRREKVAKTPKQKQLKK